MVIAVGSKAAVYVLAGLLALTLLAAILRWLIAPEDDTKTKG